MSRVDEMVASFDGREDFRDLLVEMKYSMRADHRYIESMLLGRVLRSRGRFETLYDMAVAESASALEASPRSAEFGDGEFGKWFLDWFSNGGWQAIIEFIKAIMPLFGLFI